MNDKIGGDSRDVLAIASDFAAVLDADDYAAARRLLAETCVYRLGAETIVGPDAIIDSYRTNGESAKLRFDAVEYISSVELVGPSTAAISYVDRLRIHSQWHEFRCRLRVQVGLEGLVEEITHEELPEERQRLIDLKPRLTRRGN
jgi:hypothetical protein